MSFFDEMSDQSQVKATIVAKYFMKWAMIIISTAKKNEQKYGWELSRIAYLDLFAGPGRYKAGSKSTPILVLEKAIADPDLSKRLITIFNDKDEANVRSLEEEISKIPNIQNLSHKPRVLNREIGTEIVKLFENMQLIPTLFFVDPFGYKGLSLRLVNSVLKDWGCDCIFFFNYNRIRMGLPNNAVTEHMDALFGEQLAQELRLQLPQLDPDEGELIIIEHLIKALRDMGGQYVLPFRFRNERGTRTSHHLIFVSKSVKGYEVMKEVMAVESSTYEQGVASFEYNPASERQPQLFELTRPLADLTKMLLEQFSGQTLTMIEIYQRSHVGTPFIKKNYKQVLADMEEAQLIKASKHRKGTFGDDVMVTFPK
jgi:three-Cys-motif partner protein